MWAVPEDNGNDRLPSEGVEPGSDKPPLQSDVPSDASTAPYDSDSGMSQDDGPFAGQAGMPASFHEMQASADKATDKRRELAGATARVSREQESLLVFREVAPNKAVDKALQGKRT
jgi:hypothetical protein